MKKNVLPIFGGILVLILACVSVFFAMYEPSREVKEEKNEEKNEKPVYEEPKYEKIDNSYDSYIYISSYEEYLTFLTDNEEVEVDELKEEDFNDKIYLFYKTTTDSCNENIVSYNLEKDNGKYNLLFDVNYGCGVCAPYDLVYIFEVDEILDNVDTYVKVLSRKECDPNISYKPMIYIYPENNIDLTIKLGREDRLIYTYPKYQNIWHVNVNSDGNIYDYDTNRNYYGLYWEAYDDYKIDMSKGFVVSGKDSIKFLEEKLAFLGLNEYEINEFIVYWIDKIEDNKYNFISFRSIDDINASMPLEFSINPDTLIRVMVDFVKLDEYIEVEEQVLNPMERKGFTIVEWGGTYQDGKKK